jgi:hypothetical protein
MRKAVKAAKIAGGGAEDQYVAAEHRGVAAAHSRSIED